MQLLGQQVRMCWEGKCWEGENSEGVTAHRNFNLPQALLCTLLRKPFKHKSGKRQEVS